jgi:hypothetical protein
MRKLIDKIAIEPVPDAWVKEINIIETTGLNEPNLYSAHFYYHFLFEKKSTANKFKKELIEARLCDGDTYHGVSRKLNLVSLGCYLTEINHHREYNKQEALETINDLKIKIKNKSDKLFAIYTKYQNDIVKVIFTQSYD